MTPLVFNLGPTELLIILAIVLLLFGGARLAGLGKSTGRAIKEFKEETRSIRDREEAAKTEPEPPASNATTYQQPPVTNVDDPSTSEPRREA
jgi:sec-independent protein translocase protein TatA